MDSILANKVGKGHGKYALPCLDLRQNIDDLLLGERDCFSPVVSL